MSRQLFLTAVATILLTACCFTQQASAVGCGVRIPEGGSCDDWQCSRNVSDFCVMGVLQGGSCTVDNDCYNLACKFSNASDDTTGTCQSKDAVSKNIGIGLVGAVIGVICFGSSFVPIKKYKRFAGDGVFAQFLMCFGRFIVGVCILATRDNKIFYWDAALGGALWCLGNVLSIPIIQCIGIGLGVSIWGTTNMLLGWASGHFGWWGIKVEHSKAPALEYLSVGLSAVGIVLFLFVKPVPQQLHNKDAEVGTDGAINNDDTNDDAATQKKLLAGVDLDNAASTYGGDDKSMAGPATPETKSVGDTSPTSPTDNAANTNKPKKQTLADTLGPKQARIIGITMALIAGCLYGICMDPAQHMMTRYDTLTEDAAMMKYSPFGLDYVFSNNVGAMTMSSAVLVVYLVLQKFGLTPTEKYFDKVEHAKLLLPAFAAGAIGSIASAAWFFANQNLGLVASYPIVAAGPGVVSSLWGALVFRELKGAKNFIILGGAFIAVILAAVFSSLGKVGI